MPSGGQCVRTTSRPSRIPPRRHPGSGSPPALGADTPRSRTAWIHADPSSNRDRVRHRAVTAPGHSRPVTHSRSRMPALHIAAFIAGALTILAPCSLPVLPLAVGAAATRRWLQLAAVLAGFAASFIASTVLLAAILRAADVTTQPLRLFVALVIAGAGIALAWPRAWDTFVARSGRWGPRSVPVVAMPGGPGAPSTTDRSTPKQLAMGFGFGAGLGLLW